MSGNAATDPTIRVYDWRWGPDEQRRPGLPWIGVFLVVFGVILLVEQTLPEYRLIGDAALLAAGLASLVVWVLRRGTIALYAGAFLTALAMPGTIEGLQGRDLGPGWGTLFFGLAFLFIAAVRGVARWRVRLAGAVRRRSSSSSADRRSPSPTWRRSPGRSCSSRSAPSCCSGAPSANLRLTSSTVQPGAASGRRATVVGSAIGRDERLEDLHDRRIELRAGVVPDLDPTPRLRRIALR